MSNAEETTVYWTCSASVLAGQGLSMQWLPPLLGYWAKYSVQDVWDLRNTWVTPQGACKGLHTCCSHGISPPVVTQVFQVSQPFWFGGI